MITLAIDPGLTEGGFVLMDGYGPMYIGKGPNKELASEFRSMCVDCVVIEKPVCSRFSGSDISETAIQAGIFAASMDNPPADGIYLITRSKVKGRLIGRVSGNSDSAIISYLVERFAPDTPNRGKGSKRDPGFFYGFRDDIWQAYALGVVFLDMKKYGKKSDIDYLEGGKL